MNRVEYDQVKKRNRHGMAFRIAISKSSKKPKKTRLDSLKYHESSQAITQTISRDSIATIQRIALEAEPIPDDQNIFEDYSAIEGMTIERQTQLAKRDQSIVKTLKQTKQLKCEVCSYDPVERGATKKQAHAMIDAHHKNPLCTGERLSVLEDFMLLCPTCHREIHQGINQ